MDYSEPVPGGSGISESNHLNKTGAVGAGSYKISAEKLPFSKSSLDQTPYGFILRYLATTHFEPTYARSAFPCFDEPQFKARFKMSIFRDRFHISLFNMPITSTDDVGFYMGTGLVSGDLYLSRSNRLRDILNGLFGSLYFRTILLTRAAQGW